MARISAVNCPILKSVVAPSHCSFPRDSQALWEWPAASLLKNNSDQVTKMDEIFFFFSGDIFYYNCEVLLFIFKIKAPSYVCVQVDLQ